MEPALGLEPRTSCLQSLSLPATGNDTHDIPHPDAVLATRPNVTQVQGKTGSCNGQCNGNRRGFIELAWIEGDPDDRQTCQFRREWFHTSDMQRLRSRAAALGRKYGNVYVSANLYQQSSRNSAVLPGRIVFVDDAPLNLACSFSVRTSPISKHAYFLLDQDAPATVLRDLARRAAAAIGGDPSGSDSQQIVRFPGTFNTKAKHGGRFPVALQQESGQRYTVEQLRALWPALAQPSAAPATDLNWPAVAHWLGNLGALIGADGLPRRVKPTTQTGRVLAGVVSGDSSLDRYIVGRGLVMHGYPDDEAAALLCHYCDYGKTGDKGSAWLQADIVRVLAKVRAEQPGIVPSPTRARADAPAKPLVQVERPRRGRKATLTPDKLLNFYQEEAGIGDMVMLTVAEVVQHFGVSRKTVERCERVLRGAGAIERRFFNRHQSSCIAVLRPVTIADQPTISTPVHVPPVNTLSPHQDAENTICALHGGTHPPDGTASVALGPALPVDASAASAASAPEGAALSAGVSLPLTPPITARSAVAEAFDAAGPGVVVTHKRIKRYLASNYPDLVLAPARLTILIAEERERRRVTRLRTVEQQRIAAMTEKQLRAQIASAQRHIASGLRTEPGAKPDDTPADSAKRRALWQRDRKQLAFWQCRHAAFVAQLARVIDVALARFDRTAIAEEHQERLLLTWLDEQRACQPTAPRSSAARAIAPIVPPAPVTVCTAPEADTPSAGYNRARGAALIDRLKQRTSVQAVAAA